MKTIKLILRFLGLMVVLLLPFGCRQKNNVTDIIKDHYGNNQYKISFNCNELDKPLADIYYGVNNYPTIPQPSKLGYIFQGWYFDKDFKFPYEESHLLLKMENIILYPKFVKEEFSRDGIYEIDFITRFDDTKVEKGELVQNRDDFIKFNEHINKKETYIEKADGKLYLRIVFDMLSSTPLGRPNPVNVKVIPFPGSDLQMVQELNALNERNKTIIVDITHFDLKKPIIFGAVNFMYDVPCDVSEINKIAVRYGVMFKVTNIYGFEKSYINTNKQIDDGTYLIKTYKRTFYNENSMASIFNEIYAYLIVDNGKYKLVKPFTPYTGISHHFDDKNKAQIKNRTTAFISGAIAYDILAPIEPNRVDTNFIPESYDAKKYLTTKIYFDYEEFKFYHIFDLDALNRDILLCSFVTGPMEQSVGLGQLNSIIKLDYSRMIKLDRDAFKLNIDMNKPSYTYQKSLLYSPSSVFHLNKSNELHSTVINNYVGSYFTNFYYTDSKFYSSIIEFVPTDDLLPSNSLEKFSRFQVKHFIFDYNFADKLEADICNINLVEGTGLRTSKTILNGKSFAIGEYVSLKDIYQQHISDTRIFTDCKISAYELNNLVVDYNKPVTIENEFNFTRDIAVKFENNNQTTIFHLYQKTNPTITIKDYDESKIYHSDETVKLPDIVYSWHGIKDRNFIKEYYLNDSKSINTTRVALFDDKFKTWFLPIDTTTFQMTVNIITVVYQLDNIYDEMYFKFLTFKAVQRKEYELYEVNGSEEKLLQKDFVSNETINNELKRKQVVYERGQLLDNYDLLDLVNISFKLKIGSTVNTYHLHKYRIIYADKTYDGNKDSSGFFTSYQLDEVNTSLKLTAIFNEIKTKLTSDYACLGLEYINSNPSDNKDLVKISFLTGSTISGYKNSRNVKFLNHQDLFTNNDYQLSEYCLMTNNNVVISKAWTSINLKNLVNVNSNNYYKYNYVTRNLTVFKPCTIELKGKFKIGMNFNEFGQKIFYDIPDEYYDYSFPSIEISQTYEVKSDTGDVYITYITDSEHLFLDGSDRITKKYNLKQGFSTLHASEFVTNNDFLMGYVLDKDSETVFNFYRLYHGIISENFIKKFNSSHVTLYALWDKGIKVTIDYDKPLSGKNNVVFTVYANTIEHRHKINASNLITYNIPGYVHTNWLNVNNNTTYKKDIPEIYLKEDTTFKIVYKKLHSIRFFIDESCSNTFIPTKKILDGEQLKEQECVVVPIAGKSFIGWYHGGVKFDFNNPITADMELVAKFN